MIGTGPVILKSFTSGLQNLNCCYCLAWEIGKVSVLPLTNSIKKSSPGYDKVTYSNRVAYFILILRRRHLDNRSCYCRCIVIRSCNYRHTFWPDGLSGGSNKCLLLDISRVSLSGSRCKITTWSCAIKSKKTYWSFAADMRELLLLSVPIENDFVWEESRIFNYE